MFHVPPKPASLGYPHRQAWLGVSLGTHASLRPPASPRTTPASAWSKVRSLGLPVPLGASPPLTPRKHKNVFPGSWDYLEMSSKLRDGLFSPGKSQHPNFQQPLPTCLSWGSVLTLLPLPLPPLGRATWKRRTEVTRVPVGTETPPSSGGEGRERGERGPTLRRRPAPSGSF